MVEIIGLILVYISAVLVNRLSIRDFEKIRVVGPWHIAFMNGVLQLFWILLVVIVVSVLQGYLG
jgi:hypothetical protein